MDPTLITTTEIITKFITVTVASTATSQGEGAAVGGGVGEIANTIAGMDPTGLPFGLLFVYLAVEVYKRLVPSTYAAYPGYALAINATASLMMAFAQLVYRYEGVGWRACVGLALASLPVATAYFLGAIFLHEKVRGPLSEWITQRNSPIFDMANYTPPERPVSAPQRPYMPEVELAPTPPVEAAPASPMGFEEELTGKEPQW